VLTKMVFWVLENLNDKDISIDQNLKPCAFVVKEMNKMP
jgi:hypothetical protein